MGASPSMEDLVTKWAGEINVATRWEPLKQHSKALVEFHATLLFFLREITIPQRHIQWQQYCPSAVPGMSSDPKQQRQEERKATLAKQVKALVHTYLREGWKTFFFNGSAKRYDECGYVGGIWMLFSGSLGISGPPSIKMNGRLTTGRNSRPPSPPSSRLHSTQQCSETLNMS